MYDANVWHLPLKLSVTEESPAAETGQKIKNLLWNRHISNQILAPLQSFLAENRKPKIIVY